MNVTSIALVVCAALIHATWNLYAKRAAGAGPTFVLAYSAISTVSYTPFALWLIATGGLPFTAVAIGIMLLSGLIHCIYSLALQAGYRAADLSVVYPVARGTGPALSSVGAFLLLREVPTMSGLAGLALVLGGIALIATNGRLAHFARPGAWTGIRWGLLIGGLIATYTVTDGFGVKILLIAPVILDWGSNVIRTALLVPVAIRSDWRGTMTGHWRAAIIVGVISPLGYIFVLTALSRGADLHIVAPMREMSMMVGALLGMVVLHEAVGRARLAGCAILLAGVVLLAGS